MTYKEEKEYVGHKDQFLKTKIIQMREGKADGVRVIDVRNQSGINFNVLNDKNEFEKIKHKY